MGKKKNSILQTEPSHLDHLTPMPSSRRSSIVSSSSEGSMDSKLSIMEPPVRQFDDFYSFEQFLKDETWDNEYDYYHIKVNYLPPFIMSSIHNNLEKIKPTMNSRSKKFVRHLNHHIQKHLVTEIKHYSGVDYSFERAVVERAGDGRVVFHLRDHSDHGFPLDEFEQTDRHWTLDLDVECNPESPYVTVDMKSMPVV